MQSVEKVVEKRRIARHLGRAEIRVFRDNDPMRAGVLVNLADISRDGLGLLTDVQFRDDEQLRIRVKNEIQRFTRELRAVVRWQVPMGDGMRRVGVELFTRLGPLELMMLKRAGVCDTSANGSRWV